MYGTNTIDSPLFFGSGVGGSQLAGLYTHSTPGLLNDGGSQLAGLYTHSAPGLLNSNSAKGARAQLELLVGFRQAEALNDHSCLGLLMIFHFG